MNMKNVVIAGVVSLSAVAALSGQAHAAQRPAVLRADRCSLSVNIAHPHARQRETLTVTSTAGDTTVEVDIHYKTVSHTWNITTGASRKGYHEFGVGHPTKGYTVALYGTVLIAPAGYKTGATCFTSFVPE